MTPLDRLGAKVAASQDEALAPGETRDLARARGRLLATRAPSRRGRRWLTAALAAAVLALIVMAIAVRRPKPLTFAIGATAAAGTVGDFLAAPPDAPLPVRFSDGSVLQLDAGGRARVVAVDAVGARIVLEHGAAHVSVMHRAQARWDVVAGPFDVHVTGTRFDLTWSPDAEELTLTMVDGTVVVSGAFLATGRAVAAGETLRIWAKTGRLEIASTGGAPGIGTATGATIEAPGAGTWTTTASATASTTTSTTATAAATAIATTATPSASIATSKGEWRAIAGSGKYALALAAAEREGFGALCQTAGAADVLTLGDVARFAGAGGRAREAYLAVRTRFPSSPQASLAAYALGRIAFDHAKAYAEAATWFDAYLREAPSGGLAREALGRLMESRQHAGDVAGARTAAKRYLELYPEGPHATLARSLAE